VRQHSPWPPVDPKHRTIDYIGTEGVVEPPRRADIQAILTVLARREHWLGNGESRPLDLSSTDLRRYVLTGANLTGAYLGFAQLTLSVLRDVTFDMALMQQTNLAGATLGDTSFRRAILERVDFTQARVIGPTDFEEVFLSDTVIPNDVLRGTPLWESTAGEDDTEPETGPEPQDDKNG
jgi:hypothetical protein